MVVDHGPPDMFCYEQHPTYHHRVDNEEAYNWCIVPHSSWDTILFAGLAVVIACLFQGKLSSLMVLVVGGILMGIAWPVNLLELSNSMAWWLSISPWELFFYIFLPPLLLEGGMRMDWFMFKKVVLPVVVISFLVVSASCGVMIPIMLYVFGMKDQGWTWAHAAMFAAMVGPTDAISIIAIMKTNTCSRVLKVLLDGECLLNDASTITLFIIFFEKVRKLAEGKLDHQTTAQMFGNIVTMMIKLAVIGFAVGLAFGIVMRWMLRWLRKWGAERDKQIALTLASVYLVFYVANWPAKGSGVIAVAVFGLYGSATSYWDLGPDLEESGAFEAFWDTLCFSANGIVFFYSGVAIVNFFIRSYRDMDAASITGTIWRLPLLYIVLHIVRFVLLAVFWPTYKLSGIPLGWGDLTFLTAAGLRGSVSLIMAQAVVTGDENFTGKADVVTSQVVFWTAGYVIMTLLINAPGLPYVLKWTGTGVASAQQLRQRRKARDALMSYTAESLEQLKDDPDEMLTGVDWSVVERYVDVSHSLETFVDPDYHKPSVWSKLNKRWRKSSLGWLIPCSWCSCSPGIGAKVATRRQTTQKNLPEVEPALMRQNSMGKYLGRPTLWPSAQPDSRTYNKYNRKAGGEGDSSLSRVSVSSLDEELLLTQGEDETLQYELPFLPRRKKHKEPGGEDGFVEAPQRRAMQVPSSKEFSFNQSTGSPAGLDSRGAPASVPADGGEVAINMDELETQPHQANGEQREKKTSFGPGPLGEGKVIGNGEGPSSMGESIPIRPPRISEETAEPLNSPAPLKSPWQHPELAKGVVKAPALGRRSAPVRSTYNLEDNSQGMGSTASKKPALVGAVPPMLARLSMSQSAAFSVEETQGPAAGAPAPPMLSRLSLSRTAERRVDREDSEALSGPRGFPALAKRSMPVLSHYNLSGERSAVKQSLGGAPSILMPRMSDRGGQALTKAPSVAASLPTPSLASFSIDGAPQLDVNAQELAQARIWMLTGIRRYFHTKRLHGMLSSEGLRVLDHACDEALADPDQPIRLWKALEHNTCGGPWTRGLAHVSFRIRKLIIAIQHPRLGSWFSRLASSPFRALNVVLHMQLTKVMLLACEVAMEYLLGLTSSPYVQWLQESEVWGALLAEIEEEGMRAWRFLIEREVEAPQRFSAIQSYRAAMAILRQQHKFVDHLYESGMINKQERHTMTEPIEAKQRKLEHRGPVWRAPGVTGIVARLPFMRQAPQHAVDLVLEQGQLIMLKTGTVVHFNVAKNAEEAAGPQVQMPKLGRMSFKLGSHTRTQSRGTSSQGDVSSPADNPGRDLVVNPDGALYVVISGIMKVVYEPPTGPVQEYFLGAGGMLGLYSALTGHCLPGRTEAVAQGNALGKGPVVFRLDASGIAMLRRLSAAGDHSFEQLELDMFRVAGLYLVERLKAITLARFVRSLRHFAPEYEPPPMDLAAAARGTLDLDEEVMADMMEGIGQGDANGHAWATLLVHQKKLQWAKKKAADLMADYRMQLGSSILKTVKAGEEVVQSQHMLLLSGTLEGSATAREAVGQLTVKSNHSGPHHSSGPTIDSTLSVLGPQLLPWLWGVLSADDCQSAGVGTPISSVKWRGGPEGAELLVCGTPRGPAASSLPVSRSASSRLLRDPYLAPALAPKPSSLDQARDFKPLDGFGDMSEMCRPTQFRRN